MVWVEILLTFAAAVKAVEGIVADYDVIVCCGFQFAGIAGIAEENPDVSFILVDANPTDAEGNEVSVNGEVKVSLSFAEERIPEAATAENVDAVDAALMKTARACVEEDKAECILLGCAGYVGYAEQMKAELGVLVMDGVVPAVKLCEAAVSMGIKTPKKTLMDEFSEEIKSCQLTMYQPSYHMDDEVREAIRKGCDELGLSRREMGSGAGHDSMSLAQATKAGMIFVPSVKGVSHNKEEFTSWEDIENGANVLLNTLRILDK